MTADVTLTTAEPTPTVVVAATTTWAEFPQAWRPMLDEVWAFLRGAAPAGLYENGHNVFVYLDEAPSIEVGVQVGGPFETAGRVVASALPGGPAATAVHTGRISDLGDTHRAVREWIEANGYRPAGPRWEVYGDPDPATGAFEVAVFWALETP
jgi:effector-binding domain-containing protein